MISILAAVVMVAAADNPFAETPQPDAARYKACMAQAATNPEVARRAAELWRANDGGAPAKHCLGVALAGLGLLQEGAAWLEEAADDVAAGKGSASLGAVRPPELIADLKAQAAEFWFEARDYEIAMARLTDAMGLVPATSQRMVEYLMLHARAAAGLGRYEVAAGDLSQIITRHPDNAQAYVLRATASRYLERYDEAELDLARALALILDDKDALLERGIVRRLTGDDAAAKTDWQRIIDLYPASDTAVAARRNLELLRGED